jgi:hypothetical protein
MSLICGLDFCPCKRAGECPNSGKCEPCITRHKTSPDRNPLPWCMRDENLERVKELKAAQGL